MDYQRGGTLMKRIVCPKCHHAMQLNEKRYATGKPLIIRCPKCNHRFGIRIKPQPIIPSNNATKEEQKVEQDVAAQAVAWITVIENVFHYKQDLPLLMGDNVIGRKSKAPISCPIQTDDPSIDLTHCVITVQRTTKGKLQFVLRDGPSNTGTFVDNEILGDRERRIIAPGTLFTIGATTIILKESLQD